MLLSCVSTRLSLLREHWRTTYGEDRERPLAALRSAGKPLDSLGGCLVELDADGHPCRVLDLWMPAGMMLCRDGVLVTSPYAIHRVDQNLRHVEHDVLPSKKLNAVHWIAQSQRGVLIASTGLDLLVEMDASGRTCWEWWATDHGLDIDPLGRRRRPAKDADHRGIDYGTSAHTTHLNSVVELDEHRVLCTLFHQGVLVLIDRRTGAWRTVLHGLSNPHGVRRLGPNAVSLADTGNGRALVVELRDGNARVVAEVRGPETVWLQDAAWDDGHDRWVLADGARSCLHLLGGRHGHRGTATAPLDPEWRLYSVLT